MKRTNDKEKEMDLLLSRLARREAAGASVLRAIEGDDKGRARDAAEGAHLDADELNAYAENALGPATRSRYSLHLADCETCRKSVTRLALASGVAGQRERGAASVEGSDERSWWQSIAALFALPVVRYGVPALLLFAVIMVALLATRQQRSDSLVARNKEQSPTSAVKPDEEIEENHSQVSTAQTTTATTQNESAGSASSPNEGAAQTIVKAPQEIGPNESVAGGGPKKEVAQGNANSNTAAIAPPLAGSNETLSRRPVDALAQKREDARQQPEADNANAANTSSTMASRAVPESHVSTDTLADKRDETGGAMASRQPTPASPARHEPPKIAVSEAKDDETYALKNKSGAMTKPAPSAPAMRSRGVAGRAATESSAERRNAPAGESAGEKRSVAGRTFRRQGTAWIDTAYTTPRSTVNVARGSEQYRALVADEPSIRTIAEQLGGEVILIWKGRAYRIH